MKAKTASAIALSAFMMAIPAAQAQDRDGGPRWQGWGMHMGGGWGPGMWMGWSRSDAMIDRIDGRLAYMKAELKLSAEQEEAWTAFSDEVRTAAEAHNAMMETALDEAENEKPLPERLDLRISLMESRLE